MFIGCGVPPAVPDSNRRRTCHSVVVEGNFSVRRTLFSACGNWRATLTTEGDFEDWMRSSWAPAGRLARRYVRERSTAFLLYLGEHQYVQSQSMALHVDLLQSIQLRSVPKPPTRVRQHITQIRLRRNLDSGPPRRTINHDDMRCHAALPHATRLPNSTIV